MRWTSRLWRDLGPEAPLTVTVHEENGGLRAEVEEFPGCSVTGDSMEHLQEALAEAISRRISEPGDSTPARFRFWQKIGETEGDSDPEHRIDVLVS